MAHFRLNNTHPLILNAEFLLNGSSRIEFRLEKKNQIINLELRVVRYRVSGQVDDSRAESKTRPGAQAKRKIPSYPVVLHVHRPRQAASPEASHQETRCFLLGLAGAEGRNQALAPIGLSELPLPSSYGRLYS